MIDDISDTKHKSIEMEDVCDQWNRAEEVMKIAEVVGHEVVLPSINELRYAGRRLIDYFQCTSKDPKEQESSKSILADAHMACVRATHDAIDASVSYIMLDLDNIRKNVPASSILKIDEFIKACKLVSSIGKQISLSRKNRGERATIYKGINIELERLVGSYNEVKFNKSVLEMLAGTEKNYRRRYFLIILITLFTLINISAILLVFFGYTRFFW